MRWRVGVKKKETAGGIRTYAAVNINVPKNRPLDISRDESNERRKRIFIPTNSYQFEVDIPRSLSRSSMTKSNQQPWSTFFLLFSLRNTKRYQDISRVVLSRGIRSPGTISLTVFLKFYVKSYWREASVCVSKKVSKSVIKWKQRWFFPKSERFLMEIRNLANDIVFGIGVFIHKLSGTTIETAYGIFWHPCEAGCN